MGSVDTQPRRTDGAACFVTKSFDQIGSQWRLTVLYDLHGEEKRFNELKRSTDASSRTLSRVLDDLQEMEFVSRRLEEDAPVATYYSLTEKGASLCPVFDAVEQWGRQWVEEAVEAERGRSD